MSNKEIHLYLNNVVEEISSRDKLHDKEEPLFGLESSIKGSEEAAFFAKSKDFPLEEGDWDAVLVIVNNVLLADRLDCTHPLVRDPFRQDDLF